MPTSRAGTWPASDRPRPGPRAFTIIELLVVLFIIGFIAAIILPRTTALAGVQLRAAARNLAGTIRLTYSAAALNRIPFRIAFDLENQVYWVEEKAGDEYVAAQDEMLGRRVLPDLVYLKRVLVMDRQCETSCIEYLYFTPGGYVEEATVVLATVDDERAATVFTYSMTGRAAIVLEELTREEWERSELGR